MKWRKEWKLNIPYNFWSCSIAKHEWLYSVYSKALWQHILSTERRHRCFTCFPKFVLLCLTSRGSAVRTRVLPQSLTEMWGFFFVVSLNNNKYTNCWYLIVTRFLVEIRHTNFLNSRVFNFKKLTLFQSSFFGYFLNLQTICKQGPINDLKNLIRKHFPGKCKNYL